MCVWMYGPVEDPGGPQSNKTLIKKFRSTKHDNQSCFHKDRDNYNPIMP